MAVARLIFERHTPIHGLYTFGQPRTGVAEFCLEVEQAGLFAGNRVAQESWIYEWARHCRCHCSTGSPFGIAQRGAWTVALSPGYRGQGEALLCEAPRRTREAELGTSLRGADRRARWG